MDSVLSYPDRGPWGNSRWRGNTSGYIVRDLLNQYKPTLFVDPAEGSGTSRDVARDLKIPYVGLDLHSGFNLLKDKLLSKLPREADFVFFHPPYHSMITYSGEVWGKPHADDLSRCSSYEEFLEKLNLALLNIYESLRRGGRYSVLVGDMRKTGNYTFMAGDIAQIAPGKLDGVLVKVQHNMVSNRQDYTGSFIRIAHEYVLNFKRDGVVVGLLDCALFTSSKLQDLSSATWRALVHKVLLDIGGRADLDALYSAIEETVPDKTRNRPNWKAKVRQTLQLMGAENPERGVWAVGERTS